MFSWIQRQVGEKNKKDKKEPEPEPYWGNTIEFVFPTTGGKVIKVYDGDTITIASKLPYEGSPYYRLNVRLDGIDCPEIKGKTDEEKQVAVEAREFVASLVLGRMVRLENVKSEKYGRLLARVYVDDVCVNDLLLKHHFAVSYDGGSKHVPESWVQYLQQQI
jgi:endonuclease YncB( thermonuclease family)